MLHARSVQHLDLEKSRMFARVGQSSAQGADSGVQSRV